MTTQEVLDRLKRGANPKHVVGMARFGISSTNTLGIAIPVLRGLAKEIQKMDSKTARWIAADALRELTSEKVQNRLKT